MTCPEHGDQYAYGWEETGGLFFEDDDKWARRVGADEVDHEETICDHALESDEWVEVEAERCAQVVWAARNPHDGIVEHMVMCGLWTEKVLSHERAKTFVLPNGEEVMTADYFTFLCEDGHEMEYEYA